MTDVDDKIKAGAKAVANKVDESYRDLKEAYAKEKHEANVGSQSEIGKDIERAGEKVEAGVKAVANKVDDAYRDLKTDYRKEKIRQQLD
jgi:hypothetical protein